MRRVLQIDSHVSFQIACARTVLAGGLWALLGQHLPARPFVAGLLLVLLFGAALVPPRSLRQGALLLLLALCGGAAAGRPVLSVLGPALLLGAYLGLSPGLARLQALLFGVAGALLCFGASYLPGALAEQAFLLDLPGALPPVLTGMGMGLIVGSAALVRRLRVAVDAVDGELLALLPARTDEDEIGQLVHQAFESYKEVAEVLGPYPQARGAAEDLVKKIARFGRKWREIEEQARRSGKAGLLARHQELGERLAGTTDEQARGEYERARAGLQAQIDYLQEIDAGRERAVARLHNQVATLGRLRLAALRHRSVDAGKLGEELKAVVEDLGRAGQELDAAAEALAEAPV